MGIDLPFDVLLLYKVAASAFIKLAKAKIIKILLLNAIVKIWNRNENWIELYAKLRGSRAPIYIKFYKQSISASKLQS